MRKLSFLLFLISVPGLYAPAQKKADLPAAQAAERKAVAAYQAKDFAGFLAAMVEADRLRPNHPRLLYNLADAYALNGKSDEALTTLGRLGSMGLYFAI